MVGVIEMKVFVFFCVLFCICGLCGVLCGVLCGCVGDFLGHHYFPNLWL